MPPRKGFLAWYERAAAFNIATLFVSKRSPGPPRIVCVAKDLPPSYFDRKGQLKREHVYVSNRVITSKYTIFTFLPRNLLEQFRRIAYVFFLGIAILQFFQKFATISPGLVVLPLLTVLTISAAKDGYEDIKRHQSDRRVNTTEVRVLSGGGWVNNNRMREKGMSWFRLLLSITNLGHQSVKRAVESTIPMTGGGDPDDTITNERNEIDYDVEAKLSHGESEVVKPHWKKTMWEDVRVGDYVKIMDNEPLPADILICATSEEENVAYVETKNLDGETNLKSRHAVPTLTHLRTAAACADKQNGFSVHSESPNVNMYKLDATVELDKGKQSVDQQMTLLRGTVLRNTGWVVGVVLYTGDDTKIVLNSGGTPSKTSKVERQMNPQVFINLFILAAMAVTCAIVDSFNEHKDYPEEAPWLYGDNRSTDNPSINGLVTWGFALVTFQNIVPISLYISIEGVRTIQALFIYFDKDIWYEKTDQPTLARTWNLSDDLGQIEYIFSDKTGTLTQNSMVFRHCVIGEKVYRGDRDAMQDPTEVHPNPPPPASEEQQSIIESSGHFDSDAIQDTTQQTPPVEHFFDSTLKADIDTSAEADPTSDQAAHARLLNGFFTVLSLCHTVLTVVNQETHKFEYKAQSPDEAALVQAAADMGFVFLGRDREVLKLKTPFSDEPERYELLNILEFTSARKRMSVVVRKVEEHDRRLFLLTKGADNVIFERLRPGADELKESTSRHLLEFASEGHRTLTLAYKVIPEDEYSSWSHRYHEATVAMEDREGKIEAVSNELEHDLRLLGATAIEDRLQDGVPETIADLKRAGIKIWVATGDKLETAIAIGHSTNLIARDSNLIVIRGGDERFQSVHRQMLQAVEDFFPESDILHGEDAVTRHASVSADGHDSYALHRIETITSIVGSNNGERPGGFVLVIDGTALEQALGDDEHKSLLLRLAQLCEGVICCRVSPLQKALLVRLVKDGLGSLTLAIGDGANDVSMIQAADVGVGISGEEGLQAVNSSDYAIGQFRFLKKLLLVHGHWSYARNGTMIVNFFYKNVVCIGVLWWFQIYNAWSSSFVFEYTYLLFWNSFWTVAPVIGLGLFDRIVDADVLMGVPELYRYGREGTWFGLGLFAIYMLEGVFQSAIIFFIIRYTYNTDSARSDGYQVGLYEFSTVMAIACVMVADLFTGLCTHVWTAWVFVLVLVGIVLVWIYTAIYSLITPGWIVTPVFGNNHFLFLSPYFWFTILLSICLCLAPRYLYKAWKLNFAPDDLEKLRYFRKMNPNKEITSLPLEHSLSVLKQPSRIPTSPSNPESIGNNSVRPARLSLDSHRLGSRTDMATGLSTVHRGFTLSMEENGVAMQRIQSSLSEVRQSRNNLAVPEETGRRRGSFTNLLSLRRKLHKGTE